ncbi:pentatricopeptide repeat-containing protein At2g21090-like isoform X3 [Cucurbita moschata]|uniref:Pentatricopeptide repeat-containing protein At2g21090-like isoform X3 n=1 Tax=Cucurbita moschata TaxID=3662 RepID=A0A6J1ECZ4_CUCMO|nr:pentatricopeptide repeat-containing protein At2g21090-like isoform X3 [Cucurbita moschata]
MMPLSGFFPSFDHYAFLISKCIKHKHLKVGMSLHSHLIKSALSFDPFLANRLIDMYSKCNSMENAQKAFDDLPFKNIHSWNTILASYSRAGFLSQARMIFDEMPHPNIVSYNTLISSFTHHGLYVEAMDIFWQMQQDFDRLVLDEFTFVSIVGTCACLGALEMLRQVHGAAIFIGLEFNMIVCNAVINAYGKCGEPGTSYSVFSRMQKRDVVTWTSMVVAYTQTSKLDDAFRVFRSMPVKNVHTWTALINAFVKNKYSNEALDLFQQMLEEKYSPNAFTFVGVLSACADLALIAKGKEIHAIIIRRSSDLNFPNVYMCNALVDLYSKSGDMKSARTLFNLVPKKDVVSWNSLITGFAQNGLGREALIAFRRMIEVGIKPNEVTFLGVLSACSHTGLSSEGLYIMELMEKSNDIKPSLDHYAVLIDMFGRKNRLAEALDLISRAPNASKHIGIWGAVLGACRIHDNLDLAIRAAETLFEMEPDNAGRYVMLSNVFAAASRWMDAHNVRKLMEERGFKKEVAQSFIEIRNFAEMKLRNNFPARGKHCSFVMAALAFTIVVLWAWGENSFITTSQSVQAWYRTSYSGFMVGSTYSSVIPDTVKENTEKTYSNSSTKEETVKDDAHSEVTHTYAASTINFNRSKSSENTCSYGNGEWVLDDSRPLYSGFGCKRWLSATWACRLTERTDFSYERYRWVTKDCELPAFERSEFLKRMQDKTIAFIDDSLGRQQFQSLMCMATGGEESPEIKDVGKEYGLVKAKGAIRSDGWAYRFPSINTTILYYWSTSLNELLPLNMSDPATSVAMHLDRPPAFLRNFLHLFDVLVLNTGHHWNKVKVRENRWVMYKDGIRSELDNLKEIDTAKNYTVHSIVQWLDLQLSSHPRLKVFFRTISPRHFRNGEWNNKGSCVNTTPLSRGSKVEQNRSNDPIVESAVSGTQVRMLDITALSDLRDEAHRSHYNIKGTSGGSDCLHWCLPGIPDTWNMILFAQM